ncbi:MAG: hypothetical protein ACYS76_03610 [Planctomycetota bacterium]|jgi:hypothetical protein
MDAFLCEGFRDEVVKANRAKWAPVSVVESAGAANKSLELRDKDPYDYARAVRVFPESAETKIEFKVLAKQTHRGQIVVL